MRDVNVAIAEALGIKLDQVVGFELRCWYGEVPTLKVTKRILDKRSFPTEREDTQVFDVTLRDPTPPQPFDLDRMCEKSMARVRECVEASAEAAFELLRRPHP